MSHLETLLPYRLRDTLTRIDEIIELRIRRDMPIKVTYTGESKVLNIIATAEDIGYIVATATQSSIYAYQDKLREGFLPYDGGIRIGIAGEGVIDGGKLVSIANISSLSIRLPHEVRGCASSLKWLTDNYESSIIISPPGVGKTTLLREMTRVLSRGRTNILVIDERGEIASSQSGKAMLDVGISSDIVSYTPKAVVYESAVRTMSPDIIVTDEIFGSYEVGVIVDCIRSGVKVLATLHGESVQTTLDKPIYKPLREVMSYGIVLTRNPRVGSIKEVVKLC